jgi:hypothetical protein
VVRKAFDLWSQNGGIVFRQKLHERADITIQFSRASEHSIFRSKDDIAFSFPPGPHEYSGDIIFNSDITWTVDGGAHDFFKRLMFQIGISLGMLKNNRETSVMNPSREGFSLQLDDEDREVCE